MIRILATLVIIMSSVQCKEPEKPKYIPAEDYTTIAVRDASVDSLCKLIFSSDPKLRSRAIARLGSASKKFPDYEKCFQPLIKFIQQVQEGDDYYNAMSILRTEFDDTFFTEKERRIFNKIAQDTTKVLHVRASGFILLMKLNDNRAAKAAFEIIKEKDFEKRLPGSASVPAIISYLCTMQYEPAIPRIKELVNYVINNYQTMEPPDGRDGYQKWIVDGYLMRFMKYGEKAKPYLDSLLNSTDMNVRYIAAFHLGWSGDKKVIPILIEAIEKSDDPVIRVHAINLVGRDFKLKEAIPLLQKCLKDTTVLDGKLVIRMNAKSALVIMEHHYRDGSTGIELEKNEK